ncbi:hypothetical protein ABBQ38_013043 [Trebouxia sp. C0009 RCD-2024]
MEADDSKAGSWAWKSVVQLSSRSVVAPKWLEECLALGSKVDEQQYKLELEYCGGSDYVTAALVCILSAEYIIAASPSLLTTSRAPPSFCVNPPPIRPERLTSQHHPVEEEVSLSSLQGKVAPSDTASSQPGRLYKYKRWLGHWSPAYVPIRTETELALHAIYAEDISKRIGSEPIVQALKELMKYEMAMLITEDEDDKSLRTGTGSRGNFDNVDAVC